ncbi:mRNA interferase HicA [Volucribacter psittacicida]|uniref:mRNA interferase HicA n=1 Tax=Volucribacter psittacicida TaxID=203482 RepID=A0A4R1FRR5_9PAST|nr:type II toxin-antitoxin system HicA family toxin [Volucribacter psittacicida]TCJ96159.1 mRNA interferase HicA [Volucribacter psittacicida]
MKQSEFLRWLKAQGVKVEDGTKHIKLFYRNNQSVMPRHPSKEIRKGTAENIKKQLGLK